MPPRGRPPTITPERLADIGIRLGLPNLTMANVAAELAVTQAALYKRVANLEALSGWYRSRVPALGRSPAPRPMRRVACRAT